MRAWPALRRAPINSWTDRGERADEIDDYGTNQTQHMNGLLPQRRFAVPQARALDALAIAGANARGYQGQGRFHAEMCISQPLD